MRRQRPALPRFVAWRAFSRRRWPSGPHGVPMLAARRCHDVVPCVCLPDCTCPERRRWHGQARVRLVTSSPSGS
jgi:hypothetical protein